MKQPDSPDLEDVRIPLVMTKGQARCLDDVRFSQRLDSRVEAVRLLLREAVEARGGHMPPDRPRPRGGSRKAAKAKGKAR